MDTCLPFASWEVRIFKSCNRGLENVAKSHRSRAVFSSSRSQLFATRAASKLSQKMIYSFFFLCLHQITFIAVSARKHHERVSMTLVRDMDNLTALKTNKITTFVTMPFGKRKTNKQRYLQQHLNHFILGYFFLLLTYTRSHVSASFFISYILRFRIKFRFVKKRFGFYFHQSERRNEFLTREKIVSSNHKPRFKRVVFSRAFSRSSRVALSGSFDKILYSRCTRVVRNSNFQVIKS